MHGCLSCPCMHGCLSCMQACWAHVGVEEGPPEGAKGVGGGIHGVLACVTYKYRHEQMCVCVWCVCV